MFTALRGVGEDAKLWEQSQWKGIFQDVDSAEARVNEDVVRNLGEGLACRRAHWKRNEEGLGSNGFVMSLPRKQEIREEGTVVERSLRGSSLPTTADTRPLFR